MTQKGQLSKSPRYSHVIYQKEGIEETNSLVLLLGLNLDRCRRLYTSTSFQSSCGPIWSTFKVIQKIVLKHKINGIDTQFGSIFMLEY